MLCIGDRMGGAPWSCLRMHGETSMQDKSERAHIEYSGSSLAVVHSSSC